MLPPSLLPHAELGLWRSQRLIALGSSPHSQVGPELPRENLHAGAEPQLGEDAAGSCGLSAGLSGFC